jgi:hypothetical protein
MSLVPGGYVYNATSVQQNYFLQTVFEVVPESYQELIAPVSEQPKVWKALDAYNQNLWNHISSWSERWHLTDPWMLGPCYFVAYNKFESIDGWWHGPLKLSAGDPIKFQFEYSGIYRRYKKKVGLRL